MKHLLTCLSVLALFFVLESSATANSVLLRDLAENQTMAGGSQANAGAGVIPITPDLATWIRNESLDPDWLRVSAGTVGGDPSPGFYSLFALDAVDVPEPASVLLTLAGLAVVALLRIKARRYD